MDEQQAETLGRFLASEVVTDVTRAVLQARLNADVPKMQRFFTPPEHDMLHTLANCFFPRGDAGALRRALAALDERLADGGGDGWRYDALPPDREAMRQGLARLDALAKKTHGERFAYLIPSQQENALAKLPQEIHARRFLEEILAELVGLYYSDPGVQVAEMGCLSMADALGWHTIGQAQRERWEPPPYQIPQLPSAPAAPRLPSNAPDPPMRRYALDEEVDAVVVGSGAGGAPLMARLAAAGLRVVALEAGRAWNPARDFATDERAQEKLFWRDERLSGGHDPLPFGANNSGIGLGGSTLHYTAYVPRAHQDDFRLHTDFGVGRDWPLSYDDLAPYYAEVERFLGVSGPLQYPWDARRSPYPLAPLPLNGAAQLMQRGCAALGLRTCPAPNAALSAPYEQPETGRRPACANRGFCQAGCSIGAKGSMDVTYLPAARAAGAELRPECFVTGIERDRAGRVTGVIYAHHGQEYRQRCRALFLCAGAVETPRLLLRNGIGNTSGEVGRNFMAHTAVQLWGRFAEEIHPWKGIPGGLISEDMHRPQNADFAGGYLLQSLGVMPITYATQFARATLSWGERLHTWMEAYPYTAGINICGECLPSPDNRLELTDEKDRRGLPKPRITFSNGNNEKRLLAHAERVMQEIFSAAGAADTWLYPRNAHTLGTCRMGASPQDSVVNSDGRVWETPNLYVLDGSVFPSSLSVNPALTIMALSLRAADRFLASRP